jgi:cysteinyl-tRNA synthetase
LINDDDKSTDEGSVSLLAASQALVETLGDDLDTPGALSLIDDAFDKLSSLDDIHHYALMEFLQTIDEVTGLNLLGTTPDIDEELKMLIVARERAREAKDWPQSDKLRHQIEQRGITVRDTPNGTIWEYA